MGLFLPGNERRWASYDLEVAEKLGITAAIILHRIIWSLEDKIDGNKTEYFKEGRWWMYDTRVDLAKFSGLTDKQIKGAFKTLRETKILETGQFDRRFAMRRNWFTINTAALHASIGTKGTDSSIGPKGTNTLVQKGPIDEDKRDQYIGTKGTNTSLLLILNTDNLTNTQTNTPTTASVTPLPVKKPKSKKKSPKQVSEPFLELGKKWLDFTERKTKSQNPRWTVDNFGEALEKASNTAKVPIERLTQALTYLEGDVFWTKFAHSPKTLLVISKTQDKYRILQILESMDEAATGKNTGGTRYERTPKTIDYSADNGKFAKVNDSKPWET